MTNKIKTQTLYDGQVFRIILDAPSGNILDRELMTALQQTLESLSDQSHVKLLQLTGAGRHFSFGASVQEHQREQVAGMLAQFHKLFYTLADLSIPTAALISGQCLGGGLELALMAQFLFADRTARLGQPEINLGVFPPPASLLLPLKIGQSRADDLLLTGRILKAEEAHELGLITQLFDDQETLHTGVAAWTEKHILPKSAASLRFGVRAARWQFHRALREGLKELEALYVDQLMATHDANEGITAFLEKRPPTWEDH
jgi:cyclohexa-1,5-dienecarbonyl-CoA hydratase